MYTNKKQRINIADTPEKGLNQICECQKESGKKFVSRLVEIDGMYLHFQNKNGEIMINRRDTLVKMEVI